MRIKYIMFLLLGILFVVGAAACVAMLISALQFTEWGRVVLYSVCLAVCVEASVLSFSGLKT